MDALAFGGVRTLGGIVDHEPSGTAIPFFTGRRGCPSCRPSGKLAPTSK